MHTDAMNTPLAKDKTRVTVPVTPEVHEAFKRIADVMGVSVGRAMGDWLQDTLDAAQFMGQTVAKAREAPKVVAQELHAYALGLGDMTKDLLDDLREKSRQGPGGGPRSAGGSARPLAAPDTPPSNTGVNRPRAGSKRPKK